MDRARSRQRLCSAAARAALLLVAAAATTGAASCDASEAEHGTAEVDPGPTFGAEVSVTVIGRGRVTSRSGGVDCPSSCFARVVLDDPTNADGAAQGLVLVAEATVGAHFTGWKLAPMELGIRARGPAQCSPMKRTAITSAPIAERALTIALPLGETQGVPPLGREAECADFTTVPVAYAVTATFEEDFVQRDAGPDTAPEPLVQVVFEPLPGLTAQAKELGLAGGSLYWRFQLGTGLSGIAMGSTGGGTARPIVDPDQTITSFDVDRHVAYQRGGSMWVIQAGDDQPIFLSGAPFCAAVATDTGNVYCRTASGAASALYVWPLFGGVASPALLHTLPRGFALAVDEAQQRIYVSNDPGFASGASLASIPRAGDGGAPVLTTLVANQTSPRNLVAGTSRLFWIDDRFTNTYLAMSAGKTSPTTAQQGPTNSYLPFVAADPSSSVVYFIGIPSPVNGGSSIMRITSGGSATTFRSKLTGLGGLAVDGTYVYWTQSDGRVYRAPKLATDGLEP